jgi:uncharacterized DUF497 family protein
MEITISAHAAQRAAERGITEEGIRAILADRSSTAVPSETDPDVNIVLGMFENKIWAVIFNKNTLNAVTVRRARKIERVYYEKKKGN